MSCCFCISISGPGPNLTRTWPRSGTDSKVAFMRCCCLCRNYLNEITRTYTAEMPDEALFWAGLGLGLDLTWCRCSCCSFVCFAVKSWRSNFFSLFAANNIVNCFPFSALMGITTDRHSMPAAHLHSTGQHSKPAHCVVDATWTKASTRARETTPLSVYPSAHQVQYIWIFTASPCVCLRYLILGTNAIKPFAVHLHLWPQTPALVSPAVAQVGMGRGVPKLKDRRTDGQPVCA